MSTSGAADHNVAGEPTTAVEDVGSKIRGAWILVITACRRLAVEPDHGCACTCSLCEKVWEARAALRLALLIAEKDL